MRQRAKLCCLPRCCFQDRSCVQPTFPAALQICGQDTPTATRLFLSSRQCMEPCIFLPRPQKECHWLGITDPSSAKCRGPPAIALTCIAVVPLVLITAASPPLSARFDWQETHNLVLNSARARLNIPHLQISDRKARRKERQLERKHTVSKPGIMQSRMQLQRSAEEKPEQKITVFCHS